MTEPLRILQWNSRSLYRAKLEEFRANLKNFNPLLALISETNWRNEYKVKFTTYNVFSFNHQDPGGGVAILAKKIPPHIKTALTFDKQLRYDRHHNRTRRWHQT